MSQDGLRMQAEQQLHDYEEAASELRLLRDKHPAVFERLEVLHTRMERIHKDLKRLFADTKRPPELPADETTHVWANGGWYKLCVQYKQRAPYFDPSEMPRAAFEVTGVVNAVDTEVCDSVLLHCEKSPGLWSAYAIKKLRAARVEGEPMTPVVIIAART